MATNVQAKFSFSFPGVPVRQELCQSLCDAYGQRVYALCHWMAGNEAEASALTESIFVMCLRELTENSDLAQAGDLLDRSMITHMRDRYFHPVPVRSSDGDDRQMTLEEAVRTLAASERLLFLLHDVAGYTPEKISDLMDMDECDCRRTVFHARKQLAQATM